ncbi:hypothetical protein GZL_05195 [Streptomyces sp. 769]|nr:hypothetical protein GZL_05195 [Streptomyces sp. 769]
MVPGGGPAPRLDGDLPFELMAPFIPTIPGTDRYVAELR